MAEDKRTQHKRKKKNVVFPVRLIHNESVELVSSPTGPVQTLCLSQVDKEIILDRLLKEIVNNFDFTLSSKHHQIRKRKRSDDIEKSCGDICDQEVLKTVLRSRLRVGVNSCTRALERAFHQNRSANQNAGSADKNHMQLDIIPDLVILARDIRPPNMLAHVPYFCSLLKIPVLLLPGRASKDIGKILGGKNASVIMFLKRSGEQIDDEVSIRYHRIIDSFVEFAKSKQPMSTSSSYYK
jgi:hypothetical protein